MAYKDEKKKTKEVLPAMPEDMRQELVNLLWVQSHTENEHPMHYYLTRWLDHRGLLWKYDSVGNIIATKGTVGEEEYYPCVVAHMDTVHEIEEGYGIFTRTDKQDGHEILSALINNIPAGIGGDDKCGLFACLHVLDTFEKVKVVFFTKEEGLCYGASRIDLDEFIDVGYIIELDRWGREDFICKNFSNRFVSDEFQETIKDEKKKYGYKNESGLTTDVVELFQRNVGVSCVNMSCGYYNHHTNDEYIDVNQLYNAILFLCDMVTVLGNKRYEKTYKVVKKGKTKDWGITYGGYEEDGATWYGDDNMLAIERMNHVEWEGTEKMIKEPDEEVFYQILS